MYMSLARCDFAVALPHRVGSRQTPAMGNENSDYYLRRIDLTRRATTPAAWKREDEKALIVEVAAHLREPLGLTRLEADLKSSSRLDQEALRVALGELEALANRTPPPFKPPLEGTPTYNWRKRLTSLRELLDRFSKPEVQEELEVRLQFELIGDRAIESLLECLPNPAPIHTYLTQAVASKLKLIPDEDAGTREELTASVSAASPANR